MVRLKHRYYLVRTVCPRKNTGIKFTPHLISEALKKSVKQLHGDYGLACIGSSFSVKYFNIFTQVIIIRVLRKFEQLISSSLPFISSHLLAAEDKGHDTNRYFLHTLHVSGTIRSAQKFIIRWNTKKLRLNNNVRDQ